MKREYFRAKKGRCLLFASVALWALTFTGCGAVEEEKPITGNAVVVTEEGTLVSYMVDTFDKDYYDAEELAAMALKEAEQFSNEFHLAEVPEMKVQGAEVWPDTEEVALVLEFANAESYGAYYGVDAFYGTVDEAIDAGWSLSGMLIDIKKNEALSDEKLAKCGEKMIFISGHEVDIRMPGKILAEGEDAGLKYIMMK